MGKPGIVAAVSEGKSSVSITFKQRSTRYLDDFVKLKCAPDLLALGVFPNSKEITESFAAFEAAKRFGLNWGDPALRVCVIGDGSTPRTGATFAFRTRWGVVSIDPKARSKAWNVARLGVIQARFETIEDLRKFDLYVLVHSHSSLADIPKGQNVISIPCCVKHDEYDGRPPDIEYDDWAIWSPERTVKIWHRDHLKMWGMTLDEKIAELKELPWKFSIRARALDIIDELQAENEKLRGVVDGDCKQVNDRDT